MKMQNMIKKMLFGFFALVFVMSIKTMKVNAADVVEIRTEKEWLAIGNGETGTRYELHENIQVSGTLTIPEGKSFIIYLAGYKVTGEGTMIVNNGNLTIYGNLVGTVQSVNNNKDVTVFINNGTFLFGGGNLKLSINNSSEAVTNTSRVIENNAEMRLGGGCVLGECTTSGNHVAQELQGIHNNITGKLTITSGEVYIYSKVSPIIKESMLETEIFGICNESEYPIDITGGTFYVNHDCNADSNSNTLIASPFVNAVNTAVNISNSTFWMEYEGTTNALEGMSSAIMNLSGGSVSIDNIYIVVHETGLSNTLLGGIINVDGTVIIGEERDIYIDALDTNSLSIGIVNSGNGSVKLYQGEIEAWVGFVNSSDRVIQVGIDDDIIDNNSVIVTSPLAFALGEKILYLCDGTIYGHIEDYAHIDLPDTFALREIEEGKYIVSLAPSILIEQFVTRLYQVCLNRNPDAMGKADWANRLERGEISGVQAVYGFIYSKEFKDKNLCNDDYVEQLYNAFMGRASDVGGKADWVGKLESGWTREAVFNGFAFSAEFQVLCADYGIRLGEGIGVPTYGTVPTGCCSVCGKEDGVTGFVKRLYQVCLGREADAMGLADWTNKLWNHTASGSGTAYGFIFSNEFLSKNHSNAEYVEYLYNAFMGRGSDAVGKADWVNKLNSGWSRYDVFNGFVGSQEFMGICNSYGIVR